MKLLVTKRDRVEACSNKMRQTGAKLEFCSTSIFVRAVEQRFTFYFAEALDSLLGTETEGSRPIGIHPEVESMCNCGRRAFVSGFLVLCLGALFLVLLDGQIF